MPGYQDFGVAAALDGMFTDQQARLVAALLERLHHVEAALLDMEVTHGTDEGRFEGAGELLPWYLHSQQ